MKPAFLDGFADVRQFASLQGDRIHAIAKQYKNDPLSTSIPKPGVILGLGAIALLFLTQRKDWRSSRH